MSLTSSLSPGAFAWVRDLVHRESAIVLAPGKEYLVEARLLPLARAAGARDVSDYVDGLQRTSDPRQRMLVVEALTTNETSWFRDSEPFTAMSSVILPQLMAGRGRERRVRLWSAACSSGQEAYSLAILAAEELRPRGWSMDIVGTDISSEMVERARRGRYSQLEMNRGMPAATLVKYFTRQGTEWEVSPELKKGVEFRTGNLAAPFPPMLPFDVVFLRNVLIYFDTPTKQAILQRVRSVLRPDGYLVLGGAETTLGIDEGWERVTIGRTSVHRPRGAAALTVPAVAPPVTPTLAHPLAPSVPIPVPATPAAPSLVSSNRKGV
jgi:chemotaxis protein methyltransferase CheR